MTDIPISLNRVGGKLTSGFPLLNTNNSWKIDTAYRLDHTFPLSIVHPRQSDAGTMAYFKWADTKSEYVCRPSWFGGEPPFRLTLVKAPTGMTLGGGTEQTFTRTLSAYAGVYTHSLPNDYATIRWQPTVGQHGNTYKVTLLVEDQTGGTLLITWYVAVDDTKFKYFDAVSGSDAAAGTFLAPYQTFGFGYNLANAQNYIYKYKAGTYDVHNGTTGNNAAFNSSHCSSHIGIGSGVIFNTNGGHFSSGAPDICLMNAKVSGNRADVSARQLFLDAQCNQLTLNRIEFLTTSLGATPTDNPCAVFTGNLAPSYHNNVSITDCTLNGASVSAMYILFGVSNGIIENTYSSGTVMATSNGAFVGRLKDSNYNVGVRFSDYSGDCAGGLFLVSNQQPSRCLNVDISYCRFQTIGSAFGATIRWNDQQSGSDTLPAGQYIQRCSMDASTVIPLKMEHFATGSNLVNYSGILWQSTSSTIDGGSTGGQSVGSTSAKVADINSLSSTDIGKRGWVIASTLVS